jgi:hypothetical protein
MTTIQMKFVSAGLYTGLFFVFIFIFGYWLSRSGKPYGALPFNLHKLIALGAAAFLAITAYKTHQATPLGAAQWIALLLTGLCFVITIITGGLASIEKAMPASLVRLHHIIPYLTVLFTAVSLYLLLGFTGLAAAATP